jgi:hypothetical protein
MSAEYMQIKEKVVLLHGIGHTLWNMVFIEKALKDAGYKTFNLSYPSLKHDIRTLSSWLDSKVACSQVWQNSPKVHFVTHSMGGLVAGFYLDTKRDEIPEDKMGRVVMLGPPHGGSEVADFLKGNPLYKWVFGPAGQELTTQVRTNEKITPWYELGIIAGKQNWVYPFGLYCIKDENDGCVSVTSTRIEGMKDHIIMPVLHGFMGWSPEVHEQVIHFLQTGYFSRGSSRSNKIKKRLSF